MVWHVRIGAYSVQKFIIAASWTKKIREVNLKNEVS